MLRIFIKSYNTFPKLKPILSANYTDTYRWAKCFVPLLKLFISIDYTVKASFYEDISQIILNYSKLVMAFLEVDFYFANVPLDKSIDICIKELFQMSQTVSGLNKQQYLEMFSLITKDNILFDEHFYRILHMFFLESNFGKHIFMLSQN